MSGDLEQEWGVQPTERVPLLHAVEYRVLESLDRVPVAQPATVGAGAALGRITTQAPPTVRYDLPWLADHRQFQGRNQGDGRLRRSTVRPRVAVEDWAPVASDRVPSPLLTVALGSKVKTTTSRGAEARPVLTDPAKAETARRLVEERRGALYTARLANAAGHAASLSLIHI